MKNILYTLLILSLLFLSACQAPPAQPTATEAITTPAPATATQAAVGEGVTAEAPYPYPYPMPQQATIAPPYPDSYTSVPLPTAGPTPTFDLTLGNVTGRIQEANAPVQFMSLFLAEIDADAKGTELVASFSPGESPRAETDESGGFGFYNIQPGRYALIMYTGADAFLLNEPDKDAAVTMTIEAGKTVDLGLLSYNDLPLP